MVTQAQSEANATAQTIAIARELGFYSGSDAAFSMISLTPDQQVEVTDELMQYVLNHQDEFTANAVQVATRHVANKNNNGQALADPSASIGDYAGAFGDQLLSAGEKVAGVGNGVLNTLSMTSWLIPTAAVIAVGIGLYALFLRSKPVTT